MPGKLTILACEFLQEELKRVLELDHYHTVEMGVFPGYCVRHPRGEATESPCALLEHFEHPKPGHLTIILGGGCLDGFKSLPGAGDGAGYLRADKCQKLIAGDALVEYYLGKGAYLVTPGWLRHWRRHLQDWAFDRETARLFFAESTRVLVLLDTGVFPESRDRLDEFSDYLDLPGEVLPVGLDYFRCLVHARIMGWRLGEERKARLESIAQATRRTADYEMSFDLISRLVEAESDEQAIDMILELFFMLFAPSGIIFVSTAERRQMARTWPVGAPVNDSDLIRITSLVEDYEGTEDGRGFRMRIAYRDEALGVLELEGIAFQEYRDHYLNIALTLSRVCGLAIVNARRREELQAVNRGLEGFARTVSHDLKGPLAGVVSGTELLTGLLEGSEVARNAGQVEEVAGIIRLSAEKSIAFVDDLLELASAGQEPRNVARVEVGKVVERVLEERMDLIAEKGLRVEAGENLGTVSASPVHIYQLFSNLMGNAIKYNDNTEPRVEVMRLDGEAEGIHRYLVRDNGSGIPPENLESIFAPFFKGERGGTGIGLAIVERIVNTYGGEIRAYNQNGANFEFTLHDLKL